MRVSPAVIGAGQIGESRNLLSGSRVGVDAKWRNNWHALGGSTERSRIGWHTVPSRHVDGAGGLQEHGGGRRSRSALQRQSDVDRARIVETAHALQCAEMMIER